MGHPVVTNPFYFIVDFQVTIVVGVYVNTMKTTFIAQFRFLNSCFKIQVYK